MCNEALLEAPLQQNCRGERAQTETGTVRLAEELQTTAPLRTAHLRQVNNFFYLPCRVMEKKKETLLDDPSSAFAL